MRGTVARATLGLTMAALLLAACSDTEPATPAVSPTTSAPAPQSATTPAATTPAAPASAEDLVGDWTDKEAKWTVHFKADGTFVEDLDDVTDLREGDYKVKGDRVLLIGGDGNTDRGTIEGSSLVFRLGTLQRAE